MKRKLTAVTAVLMCLLLLAACAGKKEFTDEESMLSSYKRSSDASVTFNYADGAVEPPSAYTSYTAAAQTLALKQFSSLYQPGKSFAFSPMNTVLQLGMLANAASADTRTEILTALGRMNISDLNACSSYFKSRMEYVSSIGQKETPPERVKLDGAMLLSQSTDVKSSFLHSDADYYGYDVFRFDFGGENAADKINGYFKDYAEDCGADLSKGDINLVSAAGITDTWLNGEAQVSEGSFKGAGGERKTLFFGTSETKLETGSAVGIVKYTAKNPLKLMLVMPKEGVDFDKYAAAFSFEEMNKLLDSVDITAQTAVKIPCFSVEAGKAAVPLSDSLKQNGFPTLFTDKAVFSALSYTKGSKMGEMYEIPCGISLSQSGVNSETLLSGEPKTIAGDNDGDKLIFDRPFIFALCDNESNLPVVMGVYS